MVQPLDPVQLRRLLARTLRVALDGGSAAAQLVDRWAGAEAPEQAWVTAITWDGVGAAVGWALGALDLRAVAPLELDIVASEAYDEARQRSAQLATDLTSLAAEFDAAAIPAIALKGSALLAANVAPSPGIRWVGDLNLLVAERQIEQASWLLESLAYVRGVGRGTGTAEPLRSSHESFTGPDGTIVELHWRLGPTRWGRAAAAEEWFSRAQPSARKGLLVPSSADLFWHFLLHDARNHAWSSGSLRAALDLALVARLPGFEVADVVARLQEDSRPDPLLEAIADAAHFSPVLAAQIEPSIEPRYLRLARWRDALGRRRWKAERIAEAIAWGVTLDRARRFGGLGGLLDRAIWGVPAAQPATSLGDALRGMFLNIRHAAFLALLAASHVIRVPVGRADRMKRLPRTS